MEPIRNTLDFIIIDGCTLCNLYRHQMSVYTDSSCYIMISFDHRLKVQARSGQVYRDRNYLFALIKPSFLVCTHLAEHILIKRLNHAVSFKKRYKFGWRNNLIISSSPPDKPLCTDQLVGLWSILWLIPYLKTIVF